MIVIKEENWVDLIGYEGKYQVNPKGEIRSLSRGRVHKLKAYPNMKGYLVVKLYKSKTEPKSVILHRLFAKQFLPNPNSFEQVNHKDGNHQNNSIENLEWVDNRMNINHRYTHLTGQDRKYGVYWDHKRQKWETGIYFNKKKKHIGRFDDKDDAYDAFYQAYLQIHNTPPWE